jgi:hypothetical protein
MAHVYDTWLKGYRDSPRACKWPLEVYQVYQRAKIGALLARSKLVVARPEDWPEGIYGWLCAESKPSRFVIHFGVTKPQYRKLGVFWKLVESLRPEEPQAREGQALVFSHLRPPFVETLKRHGYVFDKHAAR